MLLKSRAIVLSKLKYNDTSEIALLFTEEAGAESFIVRIPKTRRAGVKNILLQPLNILDVEWDCRETPGLRYFKNIRCRYLYTSLPYHPVKACMAQFLSEFLYYALRNEHDNRGLFQYLFTSLVWLDE